MNKDITRIELSDSDYDQIEEYSYLGYSERDIALLLGVNIDNFIADIGNENSQTYYHYARGKLCGEADVFKQLHDQAKAGSGVAITEINNIKRDKSFSSSKLDVWGGFEDKGVIDRISAYLHDNKKTLSNKEAIYMELLSLIVSLDKKYEMRGAVKFLVAPPFGFTYPKAKELYLEAINMFYADKHVSKKALRAKYAEQLEQAAQVVLSNARCSKDYEVYGGLVSQASKMRQLDIEDTALIDKVSISPAVRIYSLTAEDVGLKTNRQELAKFIDACDDIPKIEKKYLRQQAMIDNINFEQLIDNAQEKSEHKE